MKNPTIISSYYHFIGLLLARDTCANAWREYSYDTPLYMIFILEDDVGVDLCLSRMTSFSFLDFLISIVLCR